MSKIKPEVGMKASICIGTEVHPYTIIYVSNSGKSILLQADMDKITRFMGRENK